MKLFIYIDILFHKLKGKTSPLSFDAIKYTTQDIILNTTKINNTIKHKYRNTEDRLRFCVKMFIKEKLRA